MVTVSLASLEGQGTTVKWSVITSSLICKILYHTQPHPVISNYIQEFCRQWKDVGLSWLSESEEGAVDHAVFIDNI